MLYRAHMCICIFIGQLWGPEGCHPWLCNPSFTSDPLHSSDQGIPRRLSGERGGYLWYLLSGTDQEAWARTGPQHCGQEERCGRIHIRYSKFGLLQGLKEVLTYLINSHYVLIECRWVRRNQLSYVWLYVMKIFQTWEYQKYFIITCLL